KEKVLGPGVTSFVVIRRLNPGEYRFFDDFHPGMPPAMLIAKEPAIQ
ncbi:cupredoxin domain-containing protein, partial [Mesorhizobium sp. M2D.F.Ca.ET.145.01.1.1]